MKAWRAKIFLTLEWLALYIGFPLFAWSEWLDASKLLLFLLPVTYSFLIYWHRRPEIEPTKAPHRLFLVPRIALGILVLFALAWLMIPEQFLSLPRERRELWLLIIALYPIISVLPQEFYFRRFYFWRYEGLFGAGWIIMLSSALAFSLIHIVYDNWVAIILTLIGGLLFSTTYLWTRRLSLCWVEHSLYGLAIFTAGLGPYFYEKVT